MVLSTLNGLLADVNRTTHAQGAHKSLDELRNISTAPLAPPSMQRNCAAQLDRAPRTTDSMNMRTAIQVVQTAIPARSQVAGLFSDGIEQRTEMGTWRLDGSLQPHANDDHA